MELALRRGAGRGERPTQQARPATQGGADDVLMTGRPIARPRRLPLRLNEVVKLEAGRPARILGPPMRGASEVLRPADS